MMAQLRNFYRRLMGQSKPNRLLPVDALRGAIIILMALDHANSFIARSKLEPELWADMFPNYAEQPPLTFVTRLVTHLAAPGFFFLMGMGMLFLSQSRKRQGWSDWQIMRHFLIRGGLLILFQFLLENPAWGLKEPINIYFGVLYALGGAMIAGSLLIRLPWRWLLAASVALIVAVEFLLPQARTGFIAYPLPLRMWLLPGFTEPFFVLYPIMPWLGVTGLGMVYGRWLQKDRQEAYRGAFWLGAAALASFVLLRWMGGFGNIRPPVGDGWIAFLNVVKYPPSVAFLTLTLGTNLLLLALLARLPNAILWPTAVFGQVPFFFYIAHLYLYGAMGLRIEPEGICIPAMLPYWLLGLVILWPLCLVYGHFKNGRSPHSIWRFF